MKKTMKTKVVLALLMSGAVCMSGIYGAQAQDITINGNEEYNEVNLSGDGNTVTISNVTQENDEVIAGTGTGNHVEIVNSEFKAVNGATSSSAGASFNASGNEVHIINSSVAEATGGTGEHRANDNVIYFDESSGRQIYGGYSGGGEANGNKMYVNGNVSYQVIGGWAYKEASNNEVYILGGNYYIVSDNVPFFMVVGGMTCWIGGIDTINAENNKVVLAGGKIEGEVYGALSDIQGVLANNSITLTGMADVSKANLYGSGSYGTVTIEMKDNKLIVDGWQGATRSVNNFNSVDFTNILWKDGGTILSITEGKENALNNAAVNVTETNGVKLQGGQQLHAGETMTLIKSNVDIGTIAGLNDDGKKEFTTTAGVAAEVQGSIAQPSGTEVTMTIQTVDLADQTMLVAENRAVAAAFVNQGTDLISDSLDTLSHDGRYGTKTFAAVYGNRSKYDVNSDLKINGWSTIVGVGNTHKVKDGDLSWGVFYENGTGNYRTYNSFNNEFFRGDGSLLYNGGGAAVRYNWDNGWYYEGSLRAGTLKSDMDNALMDGEGNHYGYSSESNYYGAHIGVGKVFSLSADRELDVYGKFFHTYTDGDSFDVAGDRFEFDDITSDRLRIGARIRTNPEERVSTYYGLAYEYEFNGEADMRAAGLDVPTQSLQGSTCMAELGLKYQPSETSPWNFDLNVRGYAGEREGGSFHAQVSYLF